jgi:DNA-binding LytR/AlgR family response regulator
MTPRAPTALIADDEPLLRKALVRMLAEAWPELKVIAQARNGREAVEHFEAQKPDVCFLDVHMPGLSGVEAARYIGRRAQIVFVTAFDKYAVKAFETGALDYLVKPVESSRLGETVLRLKERLRVDQALPADAEALLEQLAAKLRKDGSPAGLRWLHVSIGPNLRLVEINEVDFLRSDEKYTLVAWRGQDGKPAEGLIRTPLKDLVPQLDASRFAQVHRAVVVNLRSIDHVTRAENETAQIHLKGRAEVLPVSRSYLHLFQQM